MCGQKGTQGVSLVTQNSTEQEGGWQLGRTKMCRPGCQVGREGELAGEVGGGLGSRLRPVNGTAAQQPSSPPTHELPA